MACTQLLYQSEYYKGTPPTQSGYSKDKVAERFLSRVLCYGPAKGLNLNKKF